MAGVAATFLVGLPGAWALTKSDKTDVLWWWPTNWMIIPAVVFVIGLLLVVVPVLRESQPEPPPPPQPSRTFLGGSVGGHSQLVIDSSADTFAENTRFTGNATVNARHLPGRPDLLGQEANSGEEEASTPEEAGAPGQAGPADGA